MQKIRRVDFYPDEYIAGVGGRLSPIDQGVYWMVCSMVYSRGGPIDDDHVWLSRLFADTHWRTIRASLDRLIEADKIQRVTSSGRPQITVKRCAEELQRSSKRVSDAQQNGSKGGRPSKKDNDLAKPKGSSAEKLTNNYQLTTIDSSNEESPPESPHRPVDQIKQMVTEWNELADECGLPRVERITKARRQHGKLRLDELGGIEGWRRALVKIRGSPFCKGQNDRGWRADFDFLMSPSKLTRLMEGKYDDTGTATSNGRGPKHFNDHGTQSGLSKTLERELFETLEPGECPTPSLPATPSSESS